MFLTHGYETKLEDLYACYIPFLAFKLHARIGCEMGFLFTQSA